MVYETLKTLVEVPGVSGFEEEIMNKIKDIVKVRNLADKWFFDNIGNFYCIREGSDKSEPVLLTAHVDEVGGAVKYIDEDGMIYFTPQGGVEAKIFPGQWVKIITKDKKKILGAVGTIPPHLKKGKNSEKEPKISELWIDTGASSKEEVEKIGIKKFNQIIIDRGIEKLDSPNRIIGRCFDNRIGCTVLIHILQTLAENNWKDSTIIGAFTIQEEIGLKGATVAGRIAATKHKTKTAIVIDTTSIGDFPGIKKQDAQASLGKGPVVRVADTRMVATPWLRNLIIETAEKHKVPYQVGIMGGTTDAMAIQLVHEGYAVCSICPPVRYSHSAAQVADLTDIENTIKLAYLSVKELTSQ